MSQKTGIFHYQGFDVNSKESALHFGSEKLLWFLGENLDLDLSEIQESMTDTQEFILDKFFS